MFLMVNMMAIWREIVMIRTRFVGIMLWIAGGAATMSGCVVETDESKDNVVTSKPRDNMATSEVEAIDPAVFDAQGFQAVCCKGDPCDDGNAPTCEVN